MNRIQFLQITSLLFLEELLAHALDLPSSQIHQFWLNVLLVENARKVILNPVDLHLKLLDNLFNLWALLEELNSLIGVAVEGKLILAVWTHILPVFAIRVVGRIQLLISNDKRRQQLSEISRSFSNLAGHLLPVLKFDAACIVRKGAREYEVADRRPRRVVVRHDKRDEGEETTENKANQLVNQPVYEDE